MKIGIVKTVDQSVYRFDNPEFFETDPELKMLSVLTDKGEEVFFPLNNVISFSYEEVEK